MSINVEKPFAVVTFAGTQVPVYGSAEDPLYPVSVVAAISQDVTLVSTAKKNRPPPDTDMRLIELLDGKCGQFQLFTTLGLHRYVFAKKKPADGFQQWVLGITCSFAIAAEKKKEVAAVAAAVSTKTPTPAPAPASPAPEIDWRKEYERLLERVNLVEREIEQSGQKIMGMIEECKK